MSQVQSHYNQLSRCAFNILAFLLLALPWVLGGQWLAVQMTALVLAVFAFLTALGSKGRNLKVPLGLVLCLTGYVLVQFANPAFAQEWQTGLRIWNLIPVDHISWLPSSIDSGFTDASPLRFLIIVLTATCVAFSFFRISRDLNRNYILPFIAVNASIIALIGLIQLSLDSRSILGLFQATDEGLGLFFGTFLYKNHAAAFFNLGMAVSLACFFKFATNTKNRRSNPSWLFLILTAVLLGGVIFSRSRFGFLCSLGILIVFIPLALTQIGRSGVSRKWIMLGYTVIAVLLLGGGVFLLNNKGAKHLQTLNTQITEDFSFKQRRLAYESEFRMFTEKTIYGWGAGNYRHGFRQFQNMEAERLEIRNPYFERHQLNYFWQHAHNDYLEWLIELGVVGTLILFSIPGYFFWLIFKSKRWKKPVSLMLLAGLGSTMVHALVDFPFQNPAVLVTWFAVLAITASYSEDGRAKRTVGRASGLGNHGSIH